MIGAGSGIAPFRSFWQERDAQIQNGETCGKMFLFFGCRDSKIDNIYGPELNNLLKKGVIHELFLAVSREAGHKKVIYININVWLESKFSIVSKINVVNYHNFVKHYYQCESFVIVMLFNTYIYCSVFLIVPLYVLLLQNYIQKFIPRLIKCLRLSAFGQYDVSPILKSCVSNGLNCMCHRFLKKQSVKLIKNILNSVTFRTKYSNKEL